MRFMQHANNKKGFTIVEVLVVAPIILLTIAGFIGTIVFITGEVLASRANNTLAYNVQDALNIIEQDVLFSGAFLAQNNVTLTSPQGYDNSTQQFTNASPTTGAMLVLNSAATTDPTFTPNRGLIYLANAPHDCANPEAVQNLIMTFNIVYFIKDDALWRRTILPSNYASGIGCDGATPWQLPSCYPSVSGSFCRAQDMKLLEGITSANFSIQYFNSPSATTENTNAGNPSVAVTSRQVALRETNTVQITLNASQTVAGRDINYSGTMRATRLGALTDHATPTP